MDDDLSKPGSFSRLNPSAKSGSSHFRISYFREICFYSFSFGMTAAGGSRNLKLIFGILNKVGWYFRIYNYLIINNFIIDHLIIENSIINDSKIKNSIIKILIIKDSLINNLIIKNSIIIHLSIKNSLITYLWIKNSLVNNLIITNFVISIILICGIDISWIWILMHLTVWPPRVPAHGFEFCRVLGSLSLSHRAVRNFDPETSSLLPIQTSISPSLYASTKSAPARIDIRVTVLCSRLVYLVVSESRKTRWFRVSKAERTRELWERHRKRERERERESWLWWWCYASSTHHVRPGCPSGRICVMSRDGMPCWNVPNISNGRYRGYMYR